MWIARSCNLYFYMFFRRLPAPPASELSRHLRAIRVHDHAEAAQASDVMQVLQAFGKPTKNYYLGPAQNVGVVVPIPHYALFEGAVGVMEVCLEFWRHALAQMGERSMTVLMMVVMKEPHSNLCSNSAVLSVVSAFVRTARAELSRRVKLMCMQSNAADSGLISQIEAEMDVLSTGNGVAPAEVLYHNSIRRVPELRASILHFIGKARVDLRRRGKLKYLSLKSIPSIEIFENTTHQEGLIPTQVCAVGLNFKDLLNVLLPQEAGYIQQVGS